MGSGTSPRSGTAMIVSARAIKRFNGWATIAWIAFVPVVLLTPALQKSVPLLVFVSLYANIVGHYSAYTAGRVDVRGEEEDD